jgi:DNA-binding MarR family transcriptional regulator
MITQMINELEEKDIVRRTRSDDDRRVTYISLSRRGRGMLHRLQRHGRPFGVLNELLDYLGPRDSAELARLSERISQFLNEKCGRKNHNV